MNKTGQNRLEDGHKPAKDVAEGMRRADIVEAFATALWPDIQHWQRAALRAVWEKERPIGGASRLAAETPDEAVDALVAQLDEQAEFVRDGIHHFGKRPVPSETVMLRIRKHADAIEALHKAMAALLMVIKDREPVAMEPDSKWFDDTGLPQAPPASDAVPVAVVGLQGQIDQLRRDVDLLGVNPDYEVAKHHVEIGALTAKASETGSRVAALEASQAERVVEAGETDKRVADLEALRPDLLFAAREHARRLGALEARKKELTDWMADLNNRLTTLSATVDRLSAGAVLVSKDIDPSAPVQAVPVQGGIDLATEPDVTVQWVRP